MHQGTKIWDLAPSLAPGPSSIQVRDCKREVSLTRKSISSGMMHPEGLSNPLFAKWKTSPLWTSISSSGKEISYYLLCSDASDFRFWDPVFCLRLTGVTQLPLHQRLSLDRNPGSWHLALLQDTESRQETASHHVAPAPS